MAGSPAQIIIKQKLDAIRAAIVSYHRCTVPFAAVCRPGRVLEATSMPSAIKQEISRIPTYIKDAEAREFLCVFCIAGGRQMVMAFLGLSGAIPASRSAYASFCLPPGDIV